MTYYMEENLEMPLSQVLSIVQDRILNQSTYFGVRTLKSPLDYWVYQELIYEAQPDTIIEIGNASGGSTLCLAHICDLLGRGRVIGIDLTHANVPEQVKRHPRIILIEGDACQRFEDVARLISADERVFVIDDSAHTYDNTLHVLRTYSILLKPGDYFIVEDGICHHGLPEGPQPGVFEASQAFVNENRDFEIDRSKESFLITWNPKGYLRRIRLNDKWPGVEEAEHVPTGRREHRPSFWEIARLFIPPILFRFVRKTRIACTLR